jgi:hypothetical protein
MTVDVGKLIGEDSLKKLLNEIIMMRMVIFTLLQ